MMLKVIELFSGIGSQTQALKNIGIEHEVIAVADNDASADKSYRTLHNPNVNNLGDITKIKCLPKADLWTYSFPCQDISVAGLQKGFEQGSGTRSGLLWEVERLLNECKEIPQVLLMENVPQVCNKKNLEDFRAWCRFLEGLGYKNYHSMLNSKNFGVSHNRNRCFMISLLGNYRYDFPKAFPLERKMKDFLEKNVDEKYYVNDGEVKWIVNK